MVTPAFFGCHQSYGPGRPHATLDGVCARLLQWAWRETPHERDDDRAPGPEGAAAQAEIPVARHVGIQGPGPDPPVLRGLPRAPGGADQQNLADDPARRRAHICRGPPPPHDTDPPPQPQRPRPRPTP